MARVLVELDDLRRDLVRHIAAVRDSAEIIVTGHGEPVARLSGVESPSGLQTLLREGIAMTPTPRRLPERLAGAGMVSDLVAEQRRP